MDLIKLRQTSDNKVATTFRLLLALIFLMTGPMKLLVPSLAEAFSGQLQAAGLPFYQLTLWTVPYVELALGIVLALGIFARPAAVAAIGLMVVATYVHLIVDDPTLFPLQPNEPIIPLAVIAMSVYVLLRGAGAWSFDLKASRGA
jgi:uncharacterized membrane protein YphA (DoxX/SURF4 family)